MRAWWKTDDGEAAQALADTRRQRDDTLDLIADLRRIARHLTSREPCPMACPVSDLRKRDSLDTPLDTVTSR